MSLLRRRAMMAEESHTKLEYIEFVDMAYIDTQYIPTDNTSFEFKAAFNDGAMIQYGCISTVPVTYSRFHGGAEMSPKRLIAYMTNEMGVGFGAFISGNDGAFHTYYLSKTLSKLDLIEITGSLSIPRLSIFIGSRNQENINTEMYYTMNRCRYAKIYENNELVRHYIPVLKNGTYCMYDQIQGKYYYNAAGVGCLTGG